MNEAPPLHQALQTRPGRHPNTSHGNGLLRFPSLQTAGDILQTRLRLTEIAEKSRFFWVCPVCKLPGARHGHWLTPREAAEEAEAVWLAVSCSRIEEMLNQAGDLSAKVVVI